LTGLKFLVKYKKRTVENQPMVSMEKEGAKIVRELVALDVTVWRMSKECGVSYQTAKAWKRLWWNPDEANTHKLFALLINVKKEKGLYFK